MLAARFARNGALGTELALEGRRDPELHDVVRDLYDAYHAATREALQATGTADDEVTTRLVFAALDGLSFQQIAAMMSGSTQQEYAQMMLNGGRPPDGNRSKSEWKNRG